MESTAVSFPPTSEFLSLLESLRRPPADARALTAAEIAVLERQGNRAERWDLIRVARDFIPDFVSGCLFLGGCVLGRFTGIVCRAGGIDLPSGLYHSSLDRAVIGDEALVHRSPLVAGYIIGAGAAISASTLVHRGSSSFGNGVSVRAGLETGGRIVTSFADISPEIAEAMARGLLAGNAEFEEALRRYLASVESPRGMVAGGAAVLDSRRVENSFIGAKVELKGAERVADAAILGGPDEPTRVESGAIVESSILQPGSRAASQAIVRRSILARGACAEIQAKLTDSYIASQTVVAEGEVTASFVGPLVGFHHQSLLIAAFWPAGRGNVGHGANVGSNHTSRSPDQELAAGAGMFFGLGCNVKYPANFEKSPWSIIATGVTTSPQRLAMPFSLILEPEAALGAPAGCCRVIPAWVLRENLYMVFRNEEKFRSRGRGLDPDVFTPETVRWMLEAAAGLEGIPAGKTWHDERAAAGLGKNYLLETDRPPAVEAYRRWARFACLRWLVGRLAGRIAAGEAVGFPGCIRTGAAAAFPALLAETGMLDEALERLLDGYRAGLAEAAAEMRRSRAKDHQRGSRIMPDYERTHEPVDNDDVILKFEKRMADELAKIDSIRGRS